MKNSIIQLNHVFKEFKSAERTVSALHDVSFAIAEGEYTAIVGKSGSGKSTLLNLITGIDQPSRGTLIVSGQSISNSDEQALARWRGKHVGIVFQFFQLIPTLTIRENILLAMEFVNVIPVSSREKRCAELLDKVGISQHQNKFPQALSGGEQQRAAIARALANDPPLLVADEPTGNLDSQTANQVNELLKSMTREGKTVVVVTHERDAVQRFDRVITLSDGKILNA